MNPKRYALIIGNGEYNDPKLPPLKAPAADAKALAAILGDEKIGGFDEVIPLVDQAETDVRRKISAFLANKKHDDLVLIYFSGHGVLDSRGRLYLALRDTQTDILTGTAIPSTFIVDEMNGCNSRSQVLILDCCHSGAFTHGVKAGDQKAVTETTFEGKGYGRFVLTATDSIQYALDAGQFVRGVDETKLSIFTKFLLEGLKTGRADQNNDGDVSLDEWYDYTYKWVLDSTSKQVPHKWVYGQEGALIIAKNPTPQSPKPSPPIPPPPVDDSNPRRISYKIIAALVGLVGITLVALFSYPSIKKWFAPIPATPIIIAASPTTSLPASSPSVPAVPSKLWITYNSDQNGNRDIFELNPASGEKRDVITDSSHDKVGVWSPDGKFLAFESNRNSTIYYQIYLFDNEQKKTTRLTELAECSNWSPAWSPDGTKLVFYSNCENAQRNIYMMNRDGSGREKLTSGTDEDRFPVFSPDGNSIAFTSTPKKINQIWLMDLDGGNQKYLADGCGSTFSPDGNWLWFSTNCEDSDIKRIQIDGTNLSTVGSMFGHNPSISPDGQFVVFQSNNDIWMMDVDGSNPTQLTSGSAVDGAPSWKP